MSITNELSLPFCRLVILYLNDKDGQNCQLDDRGSSNFTDIALNAIKLSIERGRHIWSELFEGLMGNLAPKVRLSHLLVSRH